MDSQFKLPEYERFDVTKALLEFSKPVNLHAVCLLLKCYDKLLDMLKNHLLNCMGRCNLP